MDLFPACFNHLYNNPYDRYYNDDLDFFSPCDYANVFPSTFYTRPPIFQYTSASRPLQKLVHNTVSNEQCCRPRTLPVNACVGDINEKKCAKATQDAAPPEKFSIHLNIAGYDPKTIRTKVECGKLIIETNQEDRPCSGDDNIRQFRKTYELPKQADVTCVTSYVAPGCVLVVEIPMRSSEDEDCAEQHDCDKNQKLSAFGQEELCDYIDRLISSDFHPRITINENGVKILEMIIDAKNCRLDEIHVSVKDNELFVCGEHKEKENHHSKRSRFSQSTTLPTGAQVLQLKKQLTCDGQLKVEIPLN